MTIGFALALGATPLFALPELKTKERCAGALRAAKERAQALVPRDVLQMPDEKSARAQFLQYWRENENEIRWSRLDLEQILVESGWQTTLESLFEDPLETARGWLLEQVREPLFKEVYRQIDTFLRYPDRDIDSDRKLATVFLLHRIVANPEKLVALWLAEHLSLYSLHFLRDGRRELQDDLPFLPDDVGRRKALEADAPRNAKIAAPTKPRFVAPYRTPEETRALGHKLTEEIREGAQAFAPYYARVIAGRAEDPEYREDNPPVLLTVVEWGRERQVTTQFALTRLRTFSEAFQADYAKFLVLQDEQRLLETKLRAVADLKKAIAEHRKTPDAPPFPPDVELGKAYNVSRLVMQRHIYPGLSVDELEYLKNHQGKARNYKTPLAAEATTEKPQKKAEEKPQ